MLRRVLPILAACHGTDTPDTPEGADALTVLTWNVGMSGRPDDPAYTDAMAGAVGAHYGHGLAWDPAIDQVADRIAAIDPDVVFLAEVFDATACPDVPEEARGGLICERWVPGDPGVPERALGTGWQIACLPGGGDKCLAVHERAGVLRDGIVTGFPVEGCGGRARVGRVVVDRPDGGVLVVVGLHGTSGVTPADQACRVAQVEQVFVDLGDGAPGANGSSNVILGDFNTDPGRMAGWDPSADRLLDFVGEGRPFRFLTPVGPETRPTYGGFASIDHVIADGWAGSCEAHGVDPGTEPVRDDGLFDHVPVACVLRLR